MSTNQSKHLDIKSKLSVQAEFTQFDTRYDSETESIWCWMHPSPRPCLNPRFLDELTQLQQQLRNTYEVQLPDSVWPFRHLIIASKIPGIYSLGGDLELFKNKIIEGDRENLKNYAYSCIDLLHKNINNLELPITMVALVQGQALGGGFEMALSCDIIIAERSAQMGFPEILFNLFPGMGAYNLLTRRIGASLAERMILSGKTYYAEELYEMGVIDILAEDDEGVEATHLYLNSHNRSHNTVQSMKKIRQIVHPITQESLIDIVDIWVDAAMGLSKKDLQKMDRLLHAQKNLNQVKPNVKLNISQLPRKGDWRKIEDISFPLKTHLGEDVQQNRRQKQCRRRD